LTTANLNIFIDTNCLALYSLNKLEELAEKPYVYLYTSWFVIKEIIAQLNDIIRGINNSIDKIESGKVDPKNSEAVIEAIKKGSFCGQGNKQFKIIKPYIHIVKDAQQEINYKEQLQIYNILKRKFIQHLDRTKLILSGNDSIKIKVLGNDENNYVNTVFNDYFNGIEYGNSQNESGILCVSKYYDDEESGRKRKLSGDITDRFIAEHFTSFFVDAFNVTAIIMTRDPGLKNYFYYWLKTNRIYNNCIVTSHTNIDNEYVSTWYHFIESIIANHELYEHKTKKDALADLQKAMKPFFVRDRDLEIMELCFDQMVATGHICKQGEGELGILYFEKETRSKLKLEKIRKEIKEGENPFL